jgi:hypothetical protein
MKSICLRVAGDFVDSFIYMGWLALFTSRRSVIWVKVEHLGQMLEARFPQAGRIPQLLFARNDWIPSQQTQALISAPELGKAYHAILDLLASQVHDFDLTELEHTEEDIALSSDAMLDVNFYYRRLYLAASDGLYHVDVSWDEDVPSLSQQCERRLDERCLSTSVGYGAVNASCGEKGLFSTLDEFGWLDATTKKTTQKVAAESIRSSWFDLDVINYSRNKLPSLFRASIETHEREGAGRGVSSDRKLITSLEPVEKTTGSWLSGFLNQHDLSIAQIQFLFNSKRVLFLQTNSGKLFTIGANRNAVGEYEVRFEREYVGAAGRILGAQSTKNGLVVETAERVLLFRKGAWNEILSESAVSVRTFTRSKRFQNLVGIVGERDFMLVSIL